MSQSMKTSQIEKWMGDFGRQYTDRNVFNPEALDALFRRNYGVTKRQLNERFLSAVPAAASILKVGCNVGNQLLHLQQMGFRNLYGIEIQPYALHHACSRLKNVHLARANSFDIPFPDAYFDLVFTSGVLIHISPGDLSTALGEIHRCTNSYIWGLDYYSPQPKEVNYRGHEGLLWKMDYASMYLKHFVDLDLVQAEELPYLEGLNVDCMFLLRKQMAVSS
jgi:pseudaminic acid biosynthesis-associated methylase